MNRMEFPMRNRIVLVAALRCWYRCCATRTEAQQAKAPEPPATVVEVATANIAHIAPRHWVPGSVVSRDDAKARASAAARLVDVAEVGTRVKAGERLAKLDDQALRLRREESRPTSRGSRRSAHSPTQRERLEKLDTSNSIAANQIDEARAQVVQLAAQLRQVEVRVRSDNTTSNRRTCTRRSRASSPNASRKRGEYVQVGATIAHLVDTTNLEAHVQAPLALAARSNRT